MGRYRPGCLRADRSAFAALQNDGVAVGGSPVTSRRHSFRRWSARSRYQGLSRSRQSASVSRSAKPMSPSASVALVTHRRSSYGAMADDNRRTLSTAPVCASSSRTCTNASITSSRLLSGSNEFMALRKSRTGSRRSQVLHLRSCRFPVPVRVMKSRRERVPVQNDLPESRGACESFWGGDRVGPRNTTSPRRRYQ